MKSYGARILIGVFLALIAGFLNFQWLRTHDAKSPNVKGNAENIPTVDYLYFANQVERGREISENDLGKISIPQSKAEEEKLDEYFTRASNKSAIVGIRSQTEYRKGAFVPNSLYMDSSYGSEGPLAAPGYRVLGPFRTLQYTNNALVVAVKYNFRDGASAKFDPKVQRLFTLLYSSNQKNLILGAVLYKRNETPENSDDQSQTDFDESELNDQDRKSEGEDVIDKLEDGEIAVSVPLMERDFPFKKRDVVGFLVPASVLDDAALQWDPTSDENMMNLDNK